MRLRLGGIQVAPQRIGDRQDFLDAMVRLQSTAYEQVLFRILSEGRGYKVLIPAPRR